MSDRGENMPVKVEVNEEEKTAIIVIPWHLVSKISGEEFRKWLVRAEAVRAQWQAKGYRCY